MDDYGFLLEMNQIQEILLYFRDPPDWEAKQYFPFKLAKLIISGDVFVTMLLLTKQPARCNHQLKVLLFL